MYQLLQLNKLLFTKSYAYFFTAMEKSLVISLAIFILIGVYGCSTTPEKPDTNSKKYKQVVSDFYVSLAAIRSDQVPFAVEKMEKVGELYPAEPAVWANLGVFAMRQGNFDRATKQLNKAIDQAPENADLQFLAGILESRKGNVEASLEHLRSAAEQDTANVRILYALADELERQNLEENAQQIGPLLDRILEKYPHNLAVLLERVRTAAKWGDLAALEESLQDLEKHSSSWPEQVQNQFEEQKSAILEKGGQDITFELAFLRNNLNPLPRFEHDLQQVQLPPSQVGFLISEFLWMQNTGHRAAKTDSTLSFTAEDAAEQASVRLFKPIGLADEQQVSTVKVAQGEAMIDNINILDFPDGGSEPLPSAAVTTIDYNYDFLNDLVFAGADGLKLYQQQEDSTFIDKTESLGIPSDVINNSYYGSWGADIDLDGDLDLILSAQDGQSQVLRNNGNGSFEVEPYFQNSEHIQDILWADFDLDGDPDIVARTKARELHLYRNERSQKFEWDDSFKVGGEVYAMDYGDLNSDGVFEIVSWQEDQIVRTWYADSTDEWQTEPLVTSADDPGQHARLFVADLDNNGALDLMTSDEKGSKYWLTNQNIQLSSEGRSLASTLVHGIGDRNGDTRLDLLGTTVDGSASVWFNNSSVNYNGRLIRPRSSRQTGDQRINSFGIGGQIESRTGMQYLRQPVRHPWVHIGLGSHEEAEVVRLIWPNGSTQTEFAELGYDSKILNEQILKGSCPWVMTYNGEKMEFVTDFIWRTALGLRINLQGKTNVMHAIDWIKIDSEQLKPRNGFYDVRITAELWETHYFDHVYLMAVDHPENTEVFVDERFIIPAPEQMLYTMKKVRPVASATDQDGKDVTDLVRHKDGEYVDSFELTAYQGLAEEHYLEVDLGENPKEKGSQKLIAAGWVYPTDTSINVALNQGEQPALQGIRVEVPDGTGGWKVVHKDIGFPSGKNKEILIDIEGVFEPNTERKARLYTNMEVYWDQIRVGIEEEGAEIKRTKLAADNSTLRYRGFSKLEQTDRFSPTVPNYQQVASTSPKWRDLEGYYTRFGEVTELTKQQDDRYVIMNAGDELQFKFPELKAPKEGWTRDFVLIGDGWIKDGDYNTIFSKTVRPLPYHGLKRYWKEPGPLQDDPVYQKHKQDWAEYHTRYISPNVFNTALKFKR